MPALRRSLEKIDRGESVGEALSDLKQCLPGCRSDTVRRSEASGGPGRDTDVSQVLHRFGIYCQITGMSLYCDSTECTGIKV
jgi:hypothetical protein